MTPENTELGSAAERSANAASPAAAAHVAALLEGAGRIIKGKRKFLELLAATALAGGHALIEDNPGLGKTTVAKTLARLIEGGDGGLVFKRIQFTPDLLPYDITGVDVFDPKTLEFRFIAGPVLANIVLADEINRATPKVQSALLEVMAERQVTIGQATHRPPEPFLVIATENPIESEGTFPLPAAQLDRFMMKLSMGYPDRAAELSILDENPAEDGLERLAPVIGLRDFMEAKKAARATFCHPALKEAIADIVRDTRIHKGFVLGASPRAGLHLLEAAKALAFVRGRGYVIDEDLSVLALPVLAHRVRFRNPSAGEKIIREICLARIGAIDAERFSENRAGASAVSNSGASANGVSANAASASDVSNSGASANDASTNAASNSGASASGVSNNGVSANDASANGVSGNGVSASDASANAASNSGASANDASANAASANVASPASAGADGAARA